MPLNTFCFSKLNVSRCLFIYKASSGELLPLTFINFHNEVVAFFLAL